MQDVFNASTTLITYAVYDDWRYMFGFTVIIWWCYSAAALVFVIQIQIYAYSRHNAHPVYGI